ncbi:hypothetical protein K1719_015463 [Acacia pycnantha]|nr:hypothetical protein K1719_015463 [Acacia pycnantha]
MRKRNVVSWTLMVTRFAQLGCLGDAIDYFFRMLLSGYKPDRSGLASDVHVGCSLVDMYTKCSADGSVENSRKVFNRMPYHNVMSWTALVDLCVNNALISMYSRCGNIEAALQVFADMGDRSVISWASIITGCAEHGFASKVLKLFYEMLEAGVMPNEVTYIAVLSACSHAGLINEGRRHFNSMYEIHGVVPRMEHCMVDLLGRSGSLSEAIEFINSMTFKADVLV